MPLTVCVVLTCDWPDCPRKPHAVHRPHASSWTEIGKLYKPEFRGWRTKTAYRPAHVERLFCPDHAPEFAKVEKRVRDWSTRYRKHTDDNGRKAGVEWATKYPPPAVPEWIRTMFPDFVSWTFAPESDESPSLET